MKLNITEVSYLLASGEERLAAVGDSPQLGQRSQPVQLAAHLDHKPGAGKHQKMWKYVILINFLIPYL